MLGHKLPLCTLQYPSGRWGFCGTVPVDLAYEYDDVGDVQRAKSSGTAIARAIAHREGRRFATRTWDDEASALAEAARLGHVVTGAA